MYNSVELYWRRKKMLHNFHNPLINKHSSSRCYHFQFNKHHCCIRWYFVRSFFSRSISAQNSVATVTHSFCFLFFYFFVDLSSIFCSGAYKSVSTIKSLHNCSMFVALCSSFFRLWIVERFFMQLILVGLAQQISANIFWTRIIHCVCSFSCYYFIRNSHQEHSYSSIAANE